MASFYRVSRRGCLSVVIAVLMVTSAGVATAQGGGGIGTPAWADALFSDMQGMAETYNENVDEAQGNMSVPTRQVYNQLKGKRVNAYFVGTDVVFSFRMTRAGHITDLRSTPRDDAQLAMYMTRDTAESLAAADEPVGAFVSAVRTGRFVGGGDDRTVRGVVINGEKGRTVENAKWTVINTAKGLLF